MPRVKKKAFSWTFRKDFGKDFWEKGLTCKGQLGRYGQHIKYMCQCHVKAHRNTTRNETRQQWTRNFICWLHNCTLSALLLSGSCAMKHCGRWSWHSLTVKMLILPSQARGTKGLCRLSELSGGCLRKFNNLAILEMAAFLLQILVTNFGSPRSRDGATPMSLITKHSKLISSVLNALRYWKSQWRVCERCRRVDVVVSMWSNQCSYTPHQHFLFGKYFVPWYGSML